jgi:hypothetical protein
MHQHIKRIGRREVAARLRVCAIGPMRGALEHAPHAAPVACEIR